MKRLFLGVFTVCLILVCLSSCGYKQNEWISEEKLSKCLIPDFPEIKDNYVIKGNNDIYVNFSVEEYKAYVSQVYEYLKSKNFEYLGTRGELQSSLSGAFNTYYFELADALEDFYVDGAYRFVYSDGKIEELDDTFRFRILTINTIGLNTTKTIEDDGVNFKYNTVISLRYNSEYPLNGRYVLPEPEHEHTGEWHRNESTHYYQYTCGCSSPDIAELHTDYDENYVCDICGYVMPEHEHTGEWVAYNKHTHYYQYTCGCTLPDRIEEHVYNDADTFCDVCGYDMSEMPPMVADGFLRNQAGCEWLNEITAEDIAEIKIVGEAFGVAPGNLKNISSSTDVTVIERIFEDYYQVETKSISKMDGQIDGGSGVTVKFILKDGTERKLYINNGNYRDPDDKYFELLYTPKFEDSDNATKANGFITYIGTGTVYDGNNDPVCEIPIDDLEFIITDYDPMLFANGYEYYINTEFGTLYFAKVEIFATDELNSVLGGADYYFIEEGNTEFCYRLVGKNLDELIAYATSPEYSLTMNDEEWLYEDLKSTYKAGETVTVKIEMAIDLGYLFLVNGKDIANCFDVDGLYWEFTFTMPACNVEIDFKTYDGFLPDRNYGILIKTYWKQNLDAGYVYVEDYYGEFSSGAIVAMIASGDYDDALWEETVGNTTIRYNNGNRILVLYEGEFYTLTTAYENGYITVEDLADIVEKHREFNPYLYE